MTGLLPMSLARPYASIERYSLFVFIGLIALMQLNVLDGFLTTSMGLVIGLFDILLTPFSLLLR
jgi:hypothetical protein